MALLSFHEVGVHFGAADVLEGINLAIEAGMKVGLVGENGSGKSSLLKLATGELQPEAGEVERCRNLQVSSMEQQPDYSGYEHGLAVVLAARPGMYELHEQLKGFESMEQIDAEASLLYAQLVAEYGSADGYGFESSCLRTLAGLGIGEDCALRSISRLSGGELARISLARCLLEESDLLLLDEPDNHLDTEGIRWLEQTLQGYGGTLVIVSHDRDLLDSVVDHVIELEDGSARLEHGGLAAYFERKRLRIERQKLEYLEQQKRMQKLRADIRRIEDSARAMENMSTNDHWRRIAKKLAKTAVVRKKKLTRELEGEQAIDRPIERSRVRLAINDSGGSASSLLWLENLGHAFGQRRMLDDVSLTLGRGERIAITGRNGCGKTTLLRILVGELEAQSGEVWLAGSATYFYCDQQQAGLDPELSLFEQLAQGSALSPNQIHYILARMGLKGRSGQAVGTLSGGERTKLLLAVLMNTQADILILDEPSNHLDLPSIEVLQEALQSFSGGVLLVSHDRRLVENVATEVYELKDGSLHHVS